MSIIVFCIDLSVIAIFIESLFPNRMEVGMPCSWI